MTFISTLNPPPSSTTCVYYCGRPVGAATGNLAMKEQGPRGRKLTPLLAGPKRADFLVRFSVSVLCVLINTHRKVYAAARYF
jgi:hypothetical protein